MSRVRLVDEDIDDTTFDQNMTKLEEVLDTKLSQTTAKLEKATISDNQPVEMTLDEAQKKVDEFNKEWETSVNAHEAKNQEMVKYVEVTNKLRDAVSEDARELLLSERRKSFEPKLNERYMLLVDAYKKLHDLTAFVVNVKNEQLKSYNDVLKKIRDDADKCTDCPCKKYFQDVA